MKNVKNIFEKIFDIIEIYLPMAAFICVFITFVIMILYRYIFYAAIGWINELNVIAFVWCGIFAASYGGRTEKHVMFPIVYDKLSEKAKLVFRFVGNIFILVIFIILIPYTVDSLSFIAIKKTSIMKIPFSIVFLPFLFFIVLTVIHYIVSIIKDIKLGLSLRKGKTRV